MTDARTRRELANFQRMTAHQDGSTTEATQIQNKREVLEAIRVMRRAVKENRVRATGVIIVLVVPDEAVGSRLSYIWEGLAPPVAADVLQRAAEQIDHDYPKPGVDRIDPTPIPRCGVCAARLPGHQDWCPELPESNHEQLPVENQPPA